MTQIKDEELAQLKEQGWPDKKIADYFTKQNRPISGLRVNQRLNKYYELQGKEKPKTKRINIKEEEMVKLKENGLTDKEIADYFTEQGITVSNTYVAKTLKKYYRLLGKEKPKIKRKIKRIGEEITDEELAKLKEQGLTDKAIEEYFMNKKIYISMYTVNKRLNRYYKLHGKVKPKITKKSDIKDEELAQLKEQGWSDALIAKYFTEQNRPISNNSVCRRLNRYYKLQGREKPKTIIRENSNIKDEELVQLKEQGWSDYLIAKYFTEQNRPISIVSVCKRLNVYYKFQGREKPKAIINSKPPNPNNKKIKKYNDNLKEILMTGITIQEFISEFEQENNKETLDNQFEKLKVLAQCSEKSNNEWKPDVNFLVVIDIIQNPSEKLKMYENNIDIYATNGICNKGKIDLIKEKIFAGNDDLMMYVSSRKKLQYCKGYDIRVYNILQKKYEQKVDMYLDRLYSIEDSRKCKKEKNKNDNNLEIEEEQR